MKSFTKNDVIVTNFYSSSYSTGSESGALMAISRVISQRPSGAIISNNVYEIESLDGIVKDCSL